MSIIGEFLHTQFARELEQEFLHAQFARELEQVLISAASDGKWGSCRSAAKGFARDQIYPLYKQHVDSSEGEVHINPELVKIYEGTETRTNG